MIETETRLDVWLWRARFFKTRSIAAAFIVKRGVRVSRGGETRKISKPGTRIAIGDVASFALRSHIVTVRVVKPGTRRGPAAEAQTLYETLDGDRPGDADA
ncbi:MAG: S4 domain-containing protein [Henriciella sp.]|uniref:S4 domain-containing protein n=1 Tax=Henriciella sp. TaxID=1968823 RepID=UPI003C77A90D